MNHRRDTHGKSKTKCQYNIPPQICKKGEKECAFDHTPSKENDNNYKCSVCSEMFPTKSQVLNHRKNNHPNKVPLCNSIKNGGICQYSPFRYNHEKTNIEKVSSAANDTTKKNVPSQNVIPETRRSEENVSTSNTDYGVGFQQDSTTTRPPDQIKEILSMIQLIMTEIQLLKESSLSNKTN